MPTDAFSDSKEKKNTAPREKHLFYSNTLRVHTDRDGHVVTQITTVIEVSEKLS